MVPVVKAVNSLGEWGGSMPPLPPCSMMLLRQCHGGVKVPSCGDVVVVVVVIMDMGIMGCPLRDKNRRIDKDDWSSSGSCWMLDVVVIPSSIPGGEPTRLRPILLFLLLLLEYVAVGFVIVVVVVGLPPVLVLTVRPNSKSCEDVARIIMVCKYCSSCGGCDNVAPPLLVFHATFTWWRNRRPNRAAPTSAEGLQNHTVDVVRNPQASLNPQIAPPPPMTSKINLGRNS